MELNISDIRIRNPQLEIEVPEEEPKINVIRVEEKNVMCPEKWEADIPRRSLLFKENYLSEFLTSVEKEQAMYNLGVSLKIKELSDKIDAMQLIEFWEVVIEEGDESDEYISTLGDHDWSELDALYEDKKMLVLLLNDHTMLPCSLLKTNSGINLAGHVDIKDKFSLDLFLNCNSTNLGKIDAKGVMYYFYTSTDKDDIDEGADFEALTMNDIISAMEWDGR